MGISRLNPSEGGIPFGDTAGRPTATTGKLYSNGETARLELYTSGGSWQNIVQEVPGVSGVSGNYSESANSGTITIAGTNFASGAIVSATGTNGVEIQASSTTFNSLVELTAVFSGLSNTNEPYDIKVTNPSNLFGILTDALYVNASPVWTTAAGSLGTFYEGVSISVSAAATDDSTITYSLASGSSLPSGITLNSSTGAISGTLPDISTDTTYTFTINASDGVNTAVSRTFSITSQPVIYELLVVAGGGSGAANDGTAYEPGGGGGAGGLIYISDLTKPGSGVSCTVTVGSGGAAPSGSNGDGGDARNGKFGADSTFVIPEVGTLTALGGAPGSVNAGVNGGSGGGSGRGTAGGGAATQTVNNLGYLSSGFGNSGGSSTRVTNASSGGGGGGAGEAGVSGVAGTGGTGGAGKLVFGNYYAAGGGGGATSVAGSGGTGGGGNGATGSSNGSNATTPGSGGGGCGSQGTAKGGAGANGIVILRHVSSITTLTNNNATVSTAGGYKYYTFTSNGSVTF
jgi:hypothetical protein